jgi:hypothetical protein
MKQEISQWIAKVARMVWEKARWETGVCALRMNETTVSVRIALELQVFAVKALVQL